MLAIQLLSASGAVANIVDVLPLVWAVILLATVMYLGLIIFFLRSKAPLWRVSGLGTAFLLALFDFKMYMSDGDAWGIESLLLLIPFLFGITTEYFLRRKRIAA